MNLLSTQYIQGKSKFYICRIKKSQLDQIKEQVSENKGNKTVLTVQKTHNLMWTEVELGFEGEDFFGAGFLSIKEFNKDMKLSYPKKYQKLNDNDIIELYIEAE